MIFTFLEYQIKTIIAVMVFSSKPRRKAFGGCQPHFNNNLTITTFLHYNIFGYFEIKSNKSCMTLSDGDI